jgi:DnaJ-class molecular chaperone
MNKTLRKAIALGRKLAHPQEKCVACNGSGRYDNTGSPKCSSCNGTGFTIPRK